MIDPELLRRVHDRTTFPDPIHNPHGCHIWTGSVRGNPHDPVRTSQRTPRIKYKNKNYESIMQILMAPKYYPLKPVIRRITNRCVNTLCVNPDHHKVTFPPPLHERLFHPTPKQKKLKPRP